MLEVGKTYKVKRTHKFHGGRSGIFQFLGGPSYTVVVLADPKDQSVLFCVGKKDILV